MPPASVAGMSRESGSRRVSESRVRPMRRRAAGAYRELSVRNRERTTT